MKFRVVDNLEEPVMNEFLCWTRYKMFTGEPTPLILAKNEAQIQAQKRQHNEGSDDEIDTSDAFKGTTFKF